MFHAAARSNFKCHFEINVNKGEKAEFKLVKVT